jgi:hypothetical protein
VHGPRPGRKRRRIEFPERTFGRIEAPHQDEPPDLEIARMGAVEPVAMRFQRRARGVQRLRRPAQVARDECDLGLGDDAPRAGHGRFRTEGARRPSQQGLRAIEIAELRHRDATQRQRGRVVAQGDPVQGAQRIADGKRARGGRDQRVHRNPATLVTLAVPRPPPLYRTSGNTQWRDER